MSTSMSTLAFIGWLWIIYPSQVCTKVLSLEFELFFNTVFFQLPQLMLNGHSARAAFYFHTYATVFQFSRRDC
jgi:hypothetical protein